MNITINLSKVLINGLSFRIDTTDKAIPVRIYQNRKHLATVPTTIQPNGEGVYGVGVLNWAIQHFVLGSMICYADPKEIAKKLKAAAGVIGLIVSPLESGKYYQVPFVNGKWEESTDDGTVILLAMRIERDHTHRRVKVIKTYYGNKDAGSSVKQKVTEEIKQTTSLIPISHDGYVYANQE